MRKYSLLAASMITGKQARKIVEANSEREAMNSVGKELCDACWYLVDCKEVKPT